MPVSSNQLESIDGTNDCGCCGLVQAERGWISCLSRELWALEIIEMTLDVLSIIIVAALVNPEATNQWLDWDLGHFNHIWPQQYFFCSQCPFLGCFFSIHSNVLYLVLKRNPLHFNVNFLRCRLLLLFLKTFSVSSSSAGVWEHSPDYPIRD